MRVFVLVAALALPLAAQEQAQQQTAPAATPAPAAVAEAPRQPAQLAEPGQPAQKTLYVPEASAFVQSAPITTSAPAFPRTEYFKQRFATPSSRVELKPPARLQDFVHGGKMELSLRDFLELVLANNTDIAIQRMNIETPKNAIERAFSVFDPAFIGRFDARREKTLPTRATDAGGSDIVNQLRQNASFTYNQMLATGAQLSVGFTGDKSSSSDVFQTWNPSIATSLITSVTQPLLRNRGIYINKLQVSIARSTLRQTEYDIRNSVLGILAQAENAYWDVIEARENLRVQEEYLRLAGEFLKRSERELELGAISKLDIYQPQQRYASAEIQVSRFRFQLAQRLDALRRFIGADLDPQVRTVPVELTETVAPPSTQETVDPEQAVQRAMLARPDLKSTIQSLDVDELRIKSATNALRPDLSLNLGYTTKGRGGMYYDRDNVFGGSQLRQIIPGGFGDAMNQLWGFDAPAYVFGLTLRLPIRDRRATADMADALVTKKQHTLRQRSLEQTIRLDVLNAVNNLESTKAGVDLAKKSVDFAQKQVDAEQLKYDLGTTVAYFVMSAQTDLVTAQSELVRQILSYHRARITLLRSTGELLDERGIILQ